MVGQFFAVGNVLAFWEIILVFQKHQGKRI